MTQSTLPPMNLSTLKVRTSEQRTTFDEVSIYNGQGYIKLIDFMGSDEDIVSAARMSTSKSFGGWGTPETPGDEKLLEYLYSNTHMTPFEMAAVVFEIEAPIFVARQVFRHRTFSYNELSARYTQLPEKYWVPAPSQVRSQNKKGNKQAGSAYASEHVANWFVESLKRAYEAMGTLYQEALDAGIAREQARVMMPVGGMTRWRQAGNLRNWLQYFRLRLDSHAQEETREMSFALADQTKAVFPRSFALFEKYSLETTLLSKDELRILERLKDQLGPKFRALLETAIDGKG